MPFDFGDVLVFAGIAAIIAGAWLVYFPAALILSGLLLILAGATKRSAE